MGADGVQVDILGHTYTIRGAADETYIRTLAAYVDEKMKVVRSRNMSAPPVEAAVMVAINIADELFRERAQSSDLDGMMKTFQELAEVLECHDACL